MLVMEYVMEVLHSDKYSIYWNLASIVGILVIGHLTLKLLSNVVRGFRAFFLSSVGIGRVNLLKYGKWAVVTGASEGIGYGYALELARRGLNIVLMSRSKEKLNKVAKEIELKYNKECKVIAVDFSEGLEIYSNISKQLGDLDVGVLVNNVGISNNYGDRMGNLPAEHLYRTVQINCQCAVQMTHVVLPKMLDQGGGYIINISSLFSLYIAPQASLYCATKAFMTFFSDGLRKEYEQRGIVVQTVVPHIVSTTMTHHPKPNYFILTPEFYARAAVAAIGIQDTTFGCFPHTVSAHLMQCFPEFVLDHNVNKLMDTSRAKHFDQQAQMDKTK